MKNLSFKKTNLKKTVITAAVGTFTLITHNTNAQSLGKVAAGSVDRDIFKINRDNSNHWGQLRLQTSNDAGYTFSNFKDHLALSFESGNNAANGAGSEIFSIDTNGQVGIMGITDPQSSLHVKGIGRFQATVSDNDYIRIGHSNANSYIDFNGEGDFKLRYEGEDLMKLTQQGNLGIGIDAPTEKLEVAGNILAEGNILTDGNITSTGNILTEGSISIGESQLSSNTENTETVLTISGILTTDKVNAEQVDSKQVVIGNSQLSSVTENENTFLTVTGGVKTDKVVLNIGTFPDYVFEDDYQLMPIEKVASYIKQNKHLPNIPAEKEMIATGMDMQMMSLKLVEKIEELTLYTIQQQEKLTQQNQLIITLLKRVEAVENK